MSMYHSKAKSTKKHCTANLETSNIWTKNKCDPLLPSSVGKMAQKEKFSAAHMVQNSVQWIARQSPRTDDDDGQELVDQTRWSKLNSLWMPHLQVTRSTSSAPEQTALETSTSCSCTEPGFIKQVLTEYQNACSPFNSIPGCAEDFKLEIRFKNRAIGISWKIFGTGLLLALNSHNKGDHIQIIWYRIISTEFT